ncbi:MAG TPA: hypothetical protein DCX07_03920 [Phycisphaerales bacterium]|nr:hypothetical protein [Phycisphaerales bacterium]
MIELLVVIAILSLLVSLLMPSLKRARDLAKSVVCMSNVRQCGVGFYVYANDFGGVVTEQTVGAPGGGSGAVALWPYFLSAGYSTFTQATGGPSYVGSLVIRCPAKQHYMEDYSTTSPPPIGGLPNRAYALYTSFGSSENGGAHSDWNFSFTTIFGPSSFYGRFQRTYMVPSPGHIVMLADSGMAWHAPEWMLGSFSTDYTKWSHVYMQGAVETTHTDRANVLFYDSHAESLTAVQLRDETFSQIQPTYDQDGKQVILP